jgi:Zn-dependent peptidase ImmA (M78 family)
MSPSKFLDDLRIAECRKAAINLLKRYHIESPDAIDVETIGWHTGKLKVKTGGIQGAEGRLMAAANCGGVIRVADMKNLGRWRFTVAHEIGHFMLHQSSIIDRTTLRKDFTVWTKAAEESEANYFAAELLMPAFMFRPHCSGEPGIKRIDALAELFGTSLLSTAFQYCAYSEEPVALVISDGWDIKSFLPFRERWPRIRFGQIHKHSAAGERLMGKSFDSGQMVRTPAYAWLEGFDFQPEKDIMEDSIYLDYYDRTITLLWIDEPL